MRLILNNNNNDNASNSRSLLELSFKRVAVLILLYSIAKGCKHSLFKGIGVYNGLFQTTLGSIKSGIRIKGGIKITKLKGCLNQTVSKSRSGYKK